MNSRLLGIYFLIVPLTLSLIIYLSVQYGFKALVIPFLLGFGLYILNKPRVIAYIFILTTVNFVGFIDPESFIRLPGVFKVNDLVFVLTMLVFAIDVAKNGFVWPKKDKDLRIVFYLVLSFVCMVFLQIVVTSLRFDLPFVSSLKVGRSYFFLLFFFYLVHFFRDAADLYSLGRFLLFVCVLQFVFLIIQMLGIDIGASNRIINLDVGGENVTRVYIPAMFYALMVFAIALTFLLNDFYKKSLLLIILFITALSIILSFTRTYWGALACSIIFVFILGGARIKLRLMKYVIPSLFIILPLMILSDDGVFVERALSIFKEIGSDEGNFVYRFTENPQRIEAFMNYPLFGPGFVHSNYAATLFNFILDLKGKSDSQIERALLLQTNDSGLITLLVSFGSIGILWVVTKVIFLFKCSSRYQKTMSEIPLALLVGSCAFIISIWLVSVTTYGFMYADGVVALTVSMYFISFALKTRFESSDDLLDQIDSNNQRSSFKKIRW